MNTMDKQFSILPFLFALLLIGSNSHIQQEPFEKLKQQFESGQILHAQFTYRYADSFTNETAVNSGELWIGRDRYRIDSSPQTVLVDGETSKVYDSNRNRLIVSEYIPEEDDFAPSRILNGLDSTYSVEQQKKEGNSYIITLRSDEPLSLYSKIKITLDQYFVPLEILAVDRADNVITTTFSDASFVKNRQSVFSITYPTDAEIIDLRD